MTGFCFVYLKEKQVKIVKSIVSPENPLLKDAEKLKLKKYRDIEGRYLVEGLNLVQEAVHNGAVIETVFCRSSSMEEEKEDLGLLLNELSDLEIPLIRLADHLFDRMADTESPQGILSIVRQTRWEKEEFFTHKEGQTGTNFLVLDRIQDPGNAGTMIRTADAAGYGGVVSIKGTVDLYGPKTVRAAAGSLFRMPLFFFNTAEEAIDTLKNYGKRVLVTTPYADHSCFEVTMDKDIALVIGNEGAGVSEPFRNGADETIGIPMDSSVDSLNAAVAAGIFMFESQRQSRAKF
jgi:TrmH family RNA methyltransferase